MCRSFKCCKGCQLSVLQMLQCFPGVAGLQCLQILQYCGSLKMLLECCRVCFLGESYKCCRKKCACKCCKAYRGCSAFIVAEFAVALEIFAGVAELSKCCEPAGFFRVLQYEILDFFSNMSFALRRLTPCSLGI